MVTGFCKLRNALSASKVHDFRSLPLSHLLLHNLKSDSGGQENFCRVLVELLGDATGDFYLFFFKISCKTDCLSVAFLYFSDDEMCCNKT